MGIIQILNIIELYKSCDSALNHKCLVISVKNNCSFIIHS